ARLKARLGRVPVVSAAGEVRPRSKPVDDPVEVALAEPVTLVVGQARPAPMFVARSRELDRDRASRRGPIPGVTQHEAPPDVEVAVEAEALVERSPSHDVLAPERHR